MEQTFEHECIGGPTLRLRVATCSALEYGRYSALRAESINLFHDTTGFWPWEAPVDGTPEAWQLLEMGITRAIVLATTRSYEVQTPDGWQPWTLPESWQGVLGFAQGVEYPLYVRWQDAALECNPGVFRAAPTDEAGKADGDDSATG